MMPASIPTTRIRIDRIDLAELRYRISTPVPMDALVRSIAAVGLMSPPILLQGSKGLTIVSGFRRISALQRLEVQAVDARLLEANTWRRCAMLAVADNALQRPLNPMETARCLALLASTVDDAKALGEMARNLGLDIHPSQFQKSLALNRLPEPIQRAVISGIITPAMALELGRLGSCDALRMTELFVELRPSLGKQREILVLGREIAKREGISICQVLAHDRMLAILQAETPDTNPKTAELRKALKQRRFPALYQAEEAFSACREKLKLPSGVQLLPPAQFEGLTYQFVLPIQSISDLKNHRDTLTRLLEEPFLKTILDR
ncbi:MAG: ParB/RepB/Spo0J family partition protein [Desulfobacterales bacterium]|nr:ParB/RepB/Spo0J family partition protein [Desulfobacterales bacterium]